MGHLIDMFDSLNLLVLVSHQFRALVESSLAADEMDDWNSIIDPTDGKLTASLKAQKSFLVSLRFFLVHAKCHQFEIRLTRVFRSVVNSNEMHL